MKIEILFYFIFSFSVYGTLKRLKFFWPYLSNKNPKIGKFEQTPFHFVASHGLSDITYFMLEEPQGAVEYYLCENGGSITPLHNASRNGNPEIIRCLQRKIDFEFINEKWLKHSLEEAVIYGHSDCVKALLEKLSLKFKKSLATEFVFRCTCKVMNKDTGKYEAKHLNAVATVENYYSFTKTQNHYEILQYLSQCY